MNEQETRYLLAAISRRDKREPSQAMLAMWHEALEDVPLDAARKALAELDRTTTEWLMPAHIRDAIQLQADRERGARKRAEAREKYQALVACSDCDERGYRHDRPLKACKHDGWKPGGLARARERLAIEHADNPSGEAERGDAA